VDSLDGTDGLLVSKTDGLNRTIASLIKQQDTINLRLTATEARLRAQFTALDTKMSSLTATSTYLTSQFNALYNNTKTSN
jgi:flagellar hook-associated protein 2